MLPLIRVLESAASVNKVIAACSGPQIPQYDFPASLDGI
jgi:hypothetical protein